MIGDAAEFLGVHPETLRRWDKSGRLPAERLRSGERIYSLAQLKAYLVNGRA